MKKVDKKLILKSNKWNFDGEVNKYFDKHVQRSVPLYTDTHKLVCSFSDYFINEGSTKRKEILAKFLDLDQFEKKFRASKNDSIETRALLKKLEDNTFDEDIIVVQIAGLIARRIVCESSIKQELKQGERIGMIRFGSRADIYFENFKPLVKVGQKTIAGETLLAKK